MRIILTGISGFVCRNLSEYLMRQKYEVEKLPLRNTTWSLSKNAVALVHLAGKAHDTKNISAEKEYFEVNTVLTQHLFDQFLHSEISDFIYFSSVKAVADSVDGVLNESVSGNPQTPYGKSKWQAEQYILSKAMPEGKRVFIIRPCMIHGPGNKGNLNLLYQLVQKGFPWPLASFDNRRSFLSIDNLNFLIQQILENKTIPSGIYNVSDDQTLSTNELIKLIAAATGKKAYFWRIPRSLVSAVAKLGNVLRLPLNSERLKKLTESYVVSNEKIKRAVGVTNLPVTAEDGLKNTISSFQNL